MCVIIHKPADKEIPAEHIIEGMRHNSQGYGVSWIEGGKVHVFHSFKQETMLRTVLEDLADKELIFHARLATSGNVDFENLHPFEIVRDQLYVAHNGVFYELSDHRSKHCDSWHFAEQMKPFFERYGLKLLDTEIFLGWAQLFCGKGSNKLAFLSPNGAVIINRQFGVELNGIWYSNTSAFPIPTRHVKRGYITQEEEDALISGMEEYREHKNQKKAGSVVGALPPATSDDEAIHNLTSTGDNFSRMKGCLNTHAFPPQEDQ